MPRIRPTCILLVIFILSFLSLAWIIIFSISSPWTIVNYFDGVDLTPNASNQKESSSPRDETQPSHYDALIVNTTTINSQRICDNDLTNQTSEQKFHRHSWIVNTTTMIEICQSCQRTKIDATNRTCEMELRHIMKSLPNQWPFWLQTMLQLAKKHGDCRQECNPIYPPKECHQSMIKTENHGLGFDDLAPILDHAFSPKLSSLDVAMAHNISNEYRLFAYNPTILPFSSDTYLASFRVSTDLYIPKPAYRNYLIVAILDITLKVLSNVLLDINHYLNLIRRDSGYDDYSHGLSDFRIFLVNGTYLLSDKFRLLPLRFIVKGNENSFANFTAKEANTTYEHEILPSIGSGIKVIAIGKLRLISNIVAGKNFQIFEVEPGNTVYVEEWPLPSRNDKEKVRRVSRLEFNPSIAESRRYDSTLLTLGMYSPDPLLVGDESQLKDDLEWGYSEDRGTTCCIRLEREFYADLTPNRTLLSFSHLILGIAHVKSYIALPRNETIQKIHGYLSRFYAILPTIPPIDVATQSPLFCWPHVLSYETETSIGNVSLQWKNRTYACPEITFSSGMTVSLSNSSRIIVAYGINDRIPVLAEISKRDVALRLFSPIPT
jgi:hypothetical protein